MSNEQIIVLSDKEKARNKIGVWHGSASNWINMVKELSGNSLDIFKKLNNNKTNKIKIIIHNNNKIEYIDSGTGIPVESVASDGRPNYEAIFEIPFAGSNYENEVATVGTNGVFLYTLAMTCEDIEFFISRPNGNIYNIAYHKGDRMKDLSIIGKSDKTYTRILFSLDKEVWDNPNFTFEEIKNIVRGQASLSNVEITLEDRKNDLKEIYYFENGIEDYFNELTSKKNFIGDNIRFSKSIQQKLSKNDTIDDINFDLLFNFSNDSEEDIQKDFLNTADLIQHGTIQNGIIIGFKNSIHKWLNDNHKYDKGDKPIELIDVSNGLNYICNLNSLNAEYVSQVKQQTASPHYKTAMKNAIEEFMETYFMENKIQAEVICKQILINSKARLSADKARQTLKKKLEGLNQPKKRIEGLTDCNFRESELDERFLLIVEGLSPKETVVESYDNRTMGALGLKGRFISCLKKSVTDVLNNVPAYTLIQALGCGIEIPYEERKNFKDIKTFDKENLKYGNIGILTDADCWGSGIRLALLTFIYKYLPTLLKENRVYIIISPRYEIKLKDGTIDYVYNDREKEQYMRQTDKSKIAHIGIVKGIGEINADDFWEKVLRPEVREKTFIQVNYNNVEEVIAQTFEDFMGKDTTARKEFAKKYITNINLAEIN